MPSGGVQTLATSAGTGHLRRHRSPPPCARGPSHLLWHRSNQFSAGLLPHSNQFDLLPDFAASSAQQLLAITFGFCFPCVAIFRRIKGGKWRYGTQGWIEGRRGGIQKVLLIQSCCWLCF